VKEVICVIALLAMRRRVKELTSLLLVKDMK
jgi:hypothetical protein